MRFKKKFLRFYIEKITERRDTVSHENEIWSAVLELLLEKFDRRFTYDLWFSDLELKKLIDEKVFLQTTNLYKKKILESKFIDMISDSFKDVMGFDVEIYIISVETRPFEEQFLEIIETQAKQQLIEEEKKKGIVFDPVYHDTDPDAKPDVIEPYGKHRKFKLSKKNLGLPKKYNSESEELEEIPLLSYMEQLEKNVGTLVKSPSVPEHKNTYTFENFVVGDSNRMAYAASLSVARYPGAQCNPLFIYGPPGIGKTHLLYAIANHIRETRPSYNIVYSTSEDFTIELTLALTNKTTANLREKYRSTDVLMIDDIQFIAGKEATQLEFFHTFNTLYESNKQIIVTCDRPPKDIAVLERRIRGRFEAGSIIKIDSPEPELRSAIIRRKAMDMNIEIPNNAVAYISNNVHENIRQIEGILKNISFQARLAKQPITEDLVRSLVGYVVTGPVDINPDIILDAVAKSTGVSREDILSKKRAKPIPMARHITCYLMSTLTDMTLMEMGNFIGRHYSTVSESIQLIIDEMADDKALEKQINDIKSSLGKK